MIDADIRHIIEPELMDGEKLLWADKPRKFPIPFMAIYMIGFSLVWMIFTLGFVGAGVFAVMSGGTEAESVAEAGMPKGFGFAFAGFSSLFVLTGIGMFLWGLKMLIGPNREIYGLTNQRGIVISPFLTYRTISLPPEKLKHSERKGGPEFGTLKFNSGSAANMWMNPYQTNLNAFRNIQNPKQVETLIYRTFQRVTS